MLNLLEKSLQTQDNGKYLFEKNVHELIIPLRTTSDEIDFEKHNLWIIDEKLAYHFYLASDVPLNKNSAIESDNNSRPDIIAFNRPHAFAVDKPYNSIVIVEFKRPNRDDYHLNNDGNNPIVIKIQLYEKSTSYIKFMSFFNDIFMYKYLFKGFIDDLCYFIGRPNI